MHPVALICIRKFIPKIAPLTPELTSTNA